MNASDIIDTVLVMLGMVGAGMLGDRLLNNWTAAMTARWERERIRDRLLRDALDTIHHLRVENDALTAIVMAQQGDE